MKNFGGKNCGREDAGNETADNHETTEVFLFMNSEYKSIMFSLRIHPMTHRRCSHLTED